MKSDGGGWEQWEPRNLHFSKSTIDFHGYPNLRTTATLPSFPDAFSYQTGKEGSNLNFNTECIFGITVENKSHVPFPLQFAEQPTQIVFSGSEWDKVVPVD